MRRILAPLLLGLIGCAILLSLCVWQVIRLSQKQAYLAQIEADMQGTPAPLPTAPDPSMKYAPVWVEGMTTGEEILILSGMKDMGGGYQVISAFQSDDGRRILIDRGFIVQDARKTPRPPVRLRLAGNLHWPDEVNASTPAPNLTENIWFAREVARMAAHLKTEPVLIVLAEAEGDLQGITPLPLTTAGIPNNHLQYAVTWFLLAVVWAGMTIGLIWRIRQRQF
ncbi:MAG: SURF1 family protein [Paracoccus sp. (in: a-proteobacteria)]|nr:SURF1 family protein [Paracoccus sp. (in: a-proteobacteria)]